MNSWSWGHVVVAIAIIGSITFLAWDKVLTGGQVIGSFGVLLGIAATSVGVSVASSAMTSRWPAPPGISGPHPPEG
jgi:hypothetical protein